MYQKIMAPLDGSELSECVLPHLEAIAKGCNVKDIVLVRIVEPFGLSSGSHVAFSNEEIKTIDSRHEAEAKEYMEAIAGGLEKKGLKAATKVIVGRVADSLAEYAEKNGVDLIIIATHGRSGISRWTWGSVADRILRSACVPVLMIRAPGCVPGI